LEQNKDNSKGYEQGLLKTGINISKAVYIVLAILCLSTIISPPIALLLGFITANLFGQPFGKALSKATKVLLQVSVVGLGFGMNLHSAIKAGSQGILFTISVIAGTLLLGYLLGRALKTDSKTATLISSGTAICGGSAIAAVSPIINANEKQVSVALGTVFILNSIALLIFPAIGHALHLSEEQFGMWSAIAIHDTSSVVGAASKYGPKALEIATTVKLARALWIIPISLGIIAVTGKQSGKVKIPYFILWFIIAMALNTYLSPIAPISPYIVLAAKSGLTLTLFLIGSGLSFKALQAVGPRPLVLGVALWIIISISSLWVIINTI